jgi:hypothetical protein
MRAFTSTRVALAALLSPLLVSMVSATKVFESSSLDSCQDNTTFTASLFNLAFFPENHTLSLNVNGDATVTGNVTFKIEAAAYGYVFLKENLNPCTMGLASFCPLNQIQISEDTVYTNISASVSNRIPSIAFGIPDLDATVTVRMYSVDNPTIPLACVRSRISNGKTVNQDGVKWGTAIVAGLGLVASAFVSGLGNFNTAAHVSLYTSSLFHYFQAVAVIGLCAVPLPPLALSWTQDFNWTLGIIRVKFLQSLATWYQLATGGKPSTIIATLDNKSVQVAKRSLESVRQHLTRRGPIQTTASGEYIVTGMDRVAFRAGMEPTNLFMTGLIFYCIFIMLALVGLVIFKGLCELALRKNWVRSQTARLQTFHDKWHITLKGIIFRIVLLGFPLISILSFWEFTQNDSGGEIFLAIVFLFGMTAALGFAAFKVIKTAKRSGAVHRTPAFLLYSDPIVLNKWGFLYIQFRASAYFYVVPTLAYILVKAIFIGLVQKSGIAQAVALVIIEAAMLIGASVIRPWMDKPANGMNITICVVNFLNAIFLLIFTDVFKGPGLLIGVTGVLFFFLNVIFAFVLLLVVLFAVIFSVVRSNPDTRYQPISDNRASFIKSQMTLPTELDQLGNSARGDSHLDQGHYGPNDSEKNLQASGLMHRTGDNTYPNTSFGGPSSPSLTPIIQSPAFPPAHYPPGGHPANSHENIPHGYGAPAGGLRPHPPTYDSGDTRSGSRPGSSRSNIQNEKTSFSSDRRNNASPWQRGAGYDH